jgi:hypothetical protein
MKKSFLAKLLVLLILVTNLSGCIILPFPWWDGRGGGHYHHHGYHGEYQDGRGGNVAHNGYGDRR